MKFSFECRSCGKKNNVNTDLPPRFGFGSSGVGATEFGLNTPHAGLGEVDSMMGYLTSRFAGGPPRVILYCKHCNEENLIQLE